MNYEKDFFPADKWCCWGWTLHRTPGYMRVYKLTDSDKYCLNVEIVNNLTKIEPLNNYLMEQLAYRKIKKYTSKQ